MDFHFNGRTKDSSNAREGVGNYHGLTPKCPCLAQPLQLSVRLLPASLAWDNYIAEDTEPFLPSGNWKWFIFKMWNEIFWIFSICLPHVSFSTEGSCKINTNHKMVNLAKFRFHYKGASSHQWCRMSFVMFRPSEETSVPSPGHPGETQPTLLLSVSAPVFLPLLTALTALFSILPFIPASSPWSSKLQFQLLYVILQDLPPNRSSIPTPDKVSFWVP